MNTPDNAPNNGPLGLEQKILAVIVFIAVLAACGVGGTALLDFLSKIARYGAWQ